MKISSTHKNLNTSYVNLSALLKFLRQQNFVGKVHFETKGYEADVFFTKENDLDARERDFLTGRISVGSDCLSNILIRAHEPGGIINVFDESEEDKAINEDFSDELESELIEVSPDEIPSEIPVEPVFETVEEEIKTKPISLKEKLGLPSLPFSFRKKEAKKAAEEAEKIEEITPEPQIVEDVDYLADWHELLDLVGEILLTVEASLAESNLNFIWVFDKVREEIYEDYPFLHPNSPVFEYKNGKVSMTEQINNHLFVVSIAESIKRLLEKLETHPKFAEVHRFVVKNLIELMNKRHAEYDKFLISQPLERIFED